MAEVAVPRELFKSILESMKKSCEWDGDAYNSQKSGRRSDQRLVIQEIPVHVPFIPEFGFEARVLARFLTDLKMVAHRSFLLTVFLLGSLFPLAYGGESPPQHVPATTVPLEAAEARKRLATILVALGSDEFATRERASKELVEFGQRAIPLVAGHVNHHDPEVAMRVRRALQQLQGVPGEAVEGLTLSAAFVGPKPRPDETVTLWLTLNNTSNRDMYIVQYFWRLALQPEHDKGTDHARTISLSTPATMEPHDFLCLKPGQSAGYLMDADPTTKAKGAALTNAYLEIALPAEARKAVDGAVFSGTAELVSGPIQMSYAEEQETPSGAASHLCEAFLKNPALTADRLRQAPEATEALRLGLRRADADERLKFFDFICQNPRPEWEDLMVDFIGRLGPRIKQEADLTRAIEALSKTLPARRVPDFLFRAALAQAHDWRSVTNLAQKRMISVEPAIRASAARSFLLLYERGDRRPEVLNWLAWELYTTPDETLHDPKMAAELEGLAVKAQPDRAEYRMSWALMRGDREGLDAIASDAKDPSTMNNLAWQLATEFPAGSALSDLAVKLASKAVELTDAAAKNYAYRMETLAICLAAKGDYAKALDLEQQAYAGLSQDDDERANYAERIAVFTALARAGKEARPVKVLDPPILKSNVARDALLERLKVEKDSLLITKITTLLRQHYGADPLVKSTLK